MNSVKELQEEIHKLNDRIADIQADCPHLDVEEYPVSDSKGVVYTMDYICRECDHYWRKQE